MTTPTVPVDPSAALIDTIKQLHTPTRISLTEERLGPDVVAVPKDMQIVSLQSYIEAARPTPVRRKTRDNVHDLDSLIELTNRHKDDTSTVVFATPDQSNPRMRTVFDYHPETSDVQDAAWREHQAFYKCPLSEEWQAWVGAHKKWLGQAEFAEFVEDRIADMVVVDPVKHPAAAELGASLGLTFATPADLVMLSRGLQVHVGSRLRNAVTTQTGEVSMSFETTHEATRQGANIQVPGLFLITIPVFFAGVCWALPVRLRYRVADATIKWSIVLYRHEVCFQDAFKGMVDRVRTSTGVPVFVGTLGDSRE